MSSAEDDIRATRTRPFATTIAADSAGYTPPASVDTTALPEQGDVVGGHYRLVRPLGEGNFGKVWVAERLDVPEHRVAMKIMPRSLYAGRNVERELVMLATVGHPNVVQLKDHGIETDFVWLTMPVYEGETLAERLDRGVLKLREAYDIFLPIARAVEALHQLGLRHQDIKPENIFLARFGNRLHPVLLDLGVAAESDGTFVAGTALYAAPEQLTAILGMEREVPLSEKMDTYCFGATLLLALVGDKFFPGAKALTRRQVIESHDVRAEKPLADEVMLDLPEVIRSQLARCLVSWMSIAPEARPSMSQVCIDLEVLLEPEREAEREEERAKNRARRSLARARWVALLVLIGAGAIGGLALWKRETLRLASEVEAARAAGEESFDKLDTCIASHGITTREARVCSKDLSDERAAHEKTLTTLSKQGEGCAEAVDSIKELRAQSVADKKKHEDEIKGMAKDCTSAKEKLTTELGGERDKFKTASETCEASVKEKDNELLKLREERDTCQQSKAAPTADPYVDPPPPGPTSHPGPGPTAAPTTQPTVAPTTQPTAPPDTSPTTPPPPDPTTPVSQSTGTATSVAPDL